MCVCASVTGLPCSPWGLAVLGLVEFFTPVGLAFVSSFAVLDWLNIEVSVSCWPSLPLAWD